MTAHPPPVPPDQQGKGPGTPEKQSGKQVQPPRDPNLEEQGRQGNIKQNTTNRGYQQDR